jgi:hypothetical protein
MRQRKNKVEVVGAEQFLGTRSQPLVASIGLTFWAMPISAGNGESPLLVLWGVIRYGECNARADDQSGL